MFGLSKPKLPVTLEQKKWVDDGFARLATLIGAERLLNAVVILPTPEHFPDYYDHSESALLAMFHRVATQMQVDPADVEVTMFVSENDLTRKLVPFYEDKSSGAAGLYHHDPSARAHISIDEKQMKDPVTLVAALAHELGHVILLRPGLTKHDEPDVEPFNDLLMVFIGFGIFTANAAFRFEQHSDYQSRGWSARRMGYLSEEVIGYALARFAFERGEAKPKWADHVPTNVRSYMKRSAACLIEQGESRLFDERSV